MLMVAASKRKTTTTKRLQQKQQVAVGWQFVAGSNARLKIASTTITTITVETKKLLEICQGCCCRHSRERFVFFSVAVLLLFWFALMWQQVQPAVKPSNTFQLQLLQHCCLTVVALLLCLICGMPIKVSWLPATHAPATISSSSSSSSNDTATVHRYATCMPSSIACNQMVYNYFITLVASSTSPIVVRRSVAHAQKEMKNC